MYAVFLGRAVETIAPATGSVTNAMLAGSIANSKLANSSVTLNGSAVSLGGSASVGGLVRLGGASATGQNVGDLSFDVFSTTYDTYYVTYVVSFTGTSQLWVRLRSSSSYLTDAKYKQTLAGKKSDGSATAIEHTTSTYFQLTNNNESSNTHNSSVGTLMFYKPAVSSKTTQIQMHTQEYDTASVLADRTGGGIFETAGNHSGFGFIGGSNNFDEYSIQVFGVIQS
jgi:hypothetical protein